MGTDSSNSVATQSPAMYTNETFNRRLGGGAYKLFDVSPRKFAILSATTLSLYVYYWAFRNWQAIQRETGERISPFWRAFFGTLWNFSLFKTIQKNARGGGIVVGWDSTLLAALFFVMETAWKLPDPGLLVSMGSFVAVLPVVRTVQRINRTIGPAPEQSDRLSRVEWAVVVGGGLFTLLVIIGLFVPE